MVFCKKMMIFHLMIFKIHFFGKNDVFFQNSAKIDNFSNFCTIFEAYNPLCLTCDCDVAFFSYLSWGFCNFARIIATFIFVDIKDRGKFIIMFQQIIGHSRAQKKKLRDDDFGFFPHNILLISNQVYLILKISFERSKCKVIVIKFLLYWEKNNITSDLFSFLKLKLFSLWGHP